MKYTILLTAFTLFFLSASLTVSIEAIADDVFIPEWRGSPGSTYQMWEFNDNLNPAFPDTVYNPYGSGNPPAVANITLGSYASGWLQQLSGLGNKQGYWDIGAEGASIVLDIMNTPIANPYKDIWVQVTYFEDLTKAPIVDVPGATMWAAPQHQVVENVSTGGQWVVEMSQWRIYPNPDHEQIILTTDIMAGAVIDQIVIDTICIPEPGTIAVLLLAGIAMKKRRF